MLNIEEIKNIVSSGEGARITVELFPDRVEIVNPGGLVSAIPPEEFGLFERMNMVEQVGSGIGRIQDDMKSAGLPEPVFNTKGIFSVIFHRRVQETTREKTREKIVRLVQRNNTITTKELAGIIGVSEKGIEFHISRLKSENILKRVGPDKGGHWEIIDK
ncbi:MAG: winged helix-turn-helix transcriptional regulator [Bacteroidales bacterium]|nr:winged helix-turn-helix transcriptional regulator [Bacteroidales bacterium]